jgi:pimeloyl-ACP methyl ester carboxylesterase
VTTSLATAVESPSAGLGHTIPFYFGDPAAPLFGVLHPADPTTAMSRGVVVCPPLGYENVIYYRQLAILARRLAGDGRAVLRFDWPGCGDSAGDDLQPNLVPAYLQAVRDAVAQLREATGVAEVDVIGLRVGATLAAQALSLGLDVSDVVLWDAFPSGRSYVRAMRAFERLSNTGEEPSDDVPEGATLATGFVVARQTLDDLAAIDLSAVEFGRRRRFLLAGGERPADEAMAERLRAQGHDVVTAELEGLRQVYLGWAEREVPTSAFEHIQAWLAPGEPATQAPAPTLRRQVEIAVDDVRLREETVALEDGSPMLGVVTTRADAPAGDTWLVFLPNRYTRRIGSNRMYTEWARRWAAAGLPSLRIDVNATGDAGGPDDETDRDMYTRAGVTDVLRAVAFLRETYGARRAAVVGLCSGGYIGFHAAVDDSTIDDAILLNPQMLLWTDHETAVARTGDIRRRLFRASSWKRLLTDRTALVRALLPTIRTAAFTDLGSRVPGVRRFRADGGGTQRVQRFISSAFDRLEARGCRVLFVFSEGDGGMRYMSRHLGPDLQEMTSRSGMSVEVVAGADHTFSRPARREELRALLQRHLEDGGFLAAGSRSSNRTG